MSYDTATIVEHLWRDFSLKPVVAAEIECYITGGVPDEKFWDALEGFVLRWEQERGTGQYEAVMPMYRDMAEAVQQMNGLKAVLAQQAESHGLKADFGAKPFADQPGSGLHIHVHLEDASGHNVFFKKDEEISAPLKHSIGGLLATMQQYMPVFAPSAESMARFAPGGNAPTTISWGANNRTVAVRLPDAGAPLRHIEHRVAGADADPEAVIAAILMGMHYGLQNKCDPGPQVYGDASLPMYNLPKLVS